MSTHRYLAMLRTRPVGYLFVTSLLARLPNGMVSLALALLASAHGSYGEAGLVVGAYVLGGALAGPVTGRAIDRLGAVRVLRLMSVVNGGTLVAVSQLPLGAPLVLASVTFFAGVLAPPINAASRSLWSVVLHGNDRAVIYAMDATFQEMIYILGPALTALAVALGGPRFALAFTGVVGAAGTFAFCAHPAAALQPGAHASIRRAQRTPVSWALLVTAALVVGSFSVVDLATVAFARQFHSPAAAGALLAAWSLGSLAAGLAWGMRVGKQPGYRLAPMVLLLGALTALPAVADGLPQLGALLFAAGLAIAPTFAMLYRLVGEEAPAAARGEAFGWLSTAFLGGAALGAFAGGGLVQRGGPILGFVAAGGIAALAAPGLLGHYRHRRRRTE